MAIYFDFDPNEQVFPVTGNKLDISFTTIDTFINTDNLGDLGR